MVKSVLGPDGIIANAFKEAASDLNTKHYLIINGDFGPVTVEGFNTICDDNKKLKFDDNT